MSDNDISDKMAADLLSRLTSAILDPDDGVYIKLDRMQNQVNNLSGDVKDMQSDLTEVKGDLGNHTLDINSLKIALENYDKNRRWGVTQVTLVIGIITVSMSALIFVITLILKFIERNTLW